MRTSLPHLTVNFKNILDQLAEHAFFVFLAVVVFELLCAVILFYLFVWVPQNENPPEILLQTKFRQETFEEMQDMHALRAKQFVEAGTFSLENLFQSPPPD